MVAGLAIEDADAATAFVRRFQAKVFGLALAVTHDPTLAEDVAQEAFVRAWSSAGTTTGCAVGIGVAPHDHPQRSDRAVRARRSVPADGDEIDRLLHAALGGGDRRRDG